MIPSSERFEKLRHSSIRLESYRDLLKNQYSKLEADEEKAKYSSELHQKCVEIFKRWLEDALDKNVHAMAELATSGLRHVISDQKLTFKIKQEMKYNRLSMKFILEQERADGVIIEGEPTGSYGGGAVVIISLVLRLAVMARMRMANLLLLDESMVALANAYVPACAEFMRQLSEQTGINILMVTHNPEFISHANIAYEAYSQNDSLKIRKLKTESM
jgi:hypothetical protein